ncbi:MAG: PAS domain S-box protein, partial [Methanolinea sp.]|nr:PAS domain S-box protein [Methanolinea sp.]
AYSMAFYGSSRPMLMDLLFDPDHLVREKYPGVRKVGETLVADIFCPALYGGKGAYVAAKASPLRDSTGKIIGAIESIRDITERIRVEAALKDTTVQLHERMKELNCLLSVSSILANAGNDQEGAISRILAKIPPAFQYPEVTAVRISLQNRVYKSDNFRITDWKLSRSFEVNGEEIGEIDVVYLEERPASFEGPFMAEERKLIDTIAERLGKFFERIWAERDISENRIFLQRLIDTITSPIFYKDTSGIYIGCNKAFEQYIGLPKEKILGKSTYDITPRELAVIYDMKDRELFLHPGTQSYESHVRYADGSIRDVIFYKATYYNTEGRPAGLVGIFTDITERKRVEEALRASKDQLRLLLDSTAEAIYGLDMNGKCTFCNTACIRMLGYATQHELIGKNMHWQIHHSHADGMPFPAEECRIFQAFQVGEGTHVDDEVLWRADGSSFPAEYWSYPQFREGKVVGAVVTFLDITERRKMEALVREKSEELDRYFSSSLDLLCIANTKGQFLRLNPEWEKVLGYSVSDLAGRRFLDFVHPEDMENTLAAISKLANQEDILNFENRYRSKDGSYRWIEWRSKPHGEIIYAVARDITERKLIEESLKKTNRQLNLLSSITRHDINNMIMVILGYLELAEDQNKDPELIKFCTHVKSATQSIRDQIAFTRIYQDLGSQDPQWQDLEKILSQCNVPGAITLDADVKGISVFADQMLEKVFFNLLDNSLRHGEHVTVIRIFATESEEGLKIVWSDNGIGIPADEKEKVFRRGYGKNTGLGLFLVREILSLTEISIRENGVPGEGARFEISVPKGVYRYLKC